MPPKRQSPLLKTTPIFVNREGPIELFENELLIIPKDKSALLVFYGQGGQGKTHLCRELVRRSDFRVNPKFDFIKRAHLDLHDRLKTDPDRALIWIRNAFAEQDLAFSTFDLAFLYYWEQVRKEESSPRLVNAMLHNAQDAVGEAGTDIGQFLGDLWQDAVDTIPGVKTIYKWASKKALKAGQESWLKRSRPETLKALFDERGQVLDAHIIKKRLAWFLAQDLNHYLNDNPDSRFVLMIDEYERVVPEGGASTAIQENPFDKIFQDVISEADGLLAVFFTREKLRWGVDPDWKNDLKDRQHSLEGLNASDAEKWLNLEKIAGEDIHKAMINGARETSNSDALVYPLLLDLQIEHYRARIANGKEIGPEHFSIAEPDFKGRCQILLERVLRDYGEPMQSTLKRLCVAERFDKTAFAHVIAEFQTGLSLDRFDRIKDMSFMTEDEDGFLLIHRAIRDVMLSWLDEGYKADSVNKLLTHYTQRSKFDPIEKAPGFESLALNQAFELRLMQGPIGLTTWVFEIEKPFYHRAKYADLEIRWKRVLDYFSVKGVAFEKDMATSYNNLAFNLKAQGRYADAEPLYRKGLEIRERILGADHPSTASSYNNLASNFKAQGRYTEAEPLYKKGLEIRERILGADHPDTAGSYNNLASNLHDQGRYADAEPLYRKGLEILERILGADHPSTASGYNNLASNLDAQGRHADAEPLYRKGLETRERILGADHPDTAGSYNNLAYNLNAQGRYAEAELLFRKCLEVCERVLGADHPYTASSYNNLASNLDDQGRHADAEPLYRKGLEIRERILGADHPDTASSYNNLAYNLNAQGRYADAEPLYRKGLEICERVLGSQHPTTIIIRENYEFEKRKLG